MGAASVNPCVYWTEHSIHAEEAPPGNGWILAWCMLTGFAWSFSQIISVSASNMTMISVYSFIIPFLYAHICTGCYGKSSCIDHSLYLVMVEMHYKRPKVVKPMIPLALLSSNGQTQRKLMQADRWYPSLWVTLGLDLSVYFPRFHPALYIHSVQSRDRRR